MTAEGDWRGRVERLLAAGNGAKAEAICRRALRREPQDAAAHLFMGRIALDSGRREQALEHYKAAMAAAPQESEPYIGLGRIALDEGQYQPATRFLLHALDLAPQRVDGYYHLGLAAQHLGQLELATLAYETALTLRHDHPEAHNNLGALLLARGEMERAERHFLEACRLRPSLRAAAENLADLYLRAERHPEATRVLARLAGRHPREGALALKAAAAGALANEATARERLRRKVARRITPGSMATPLAKLPPGDLALLARAHATLTADTAAHEPIRLLWNQSVLAALAGMQEERERLLRRLAEEFRYAPAWRELGVLAANRLEWDRARERYSAALALDPEEPDSLNGAAAVLLVGEAVPRIAKALPLLERALARAPRHASILLNLGFAYLRCGDPRAVGVLRRAVQAAPESAEAHNNLALALLCAGDLAEGWKEHEWRLRTPTYRARPFPWPQWQGQPLAGKTVLAHAEQGLGDELLFASCLPDLIALGARVIIECDRRLVPLFARSFPGASVVPRIAYGTLPAIAHLPAPAFQVPLGSLPCHFRRTPGAFPRTPYLSADPERVAHWRARLDALGPGRKIGFSWRSGLTGSGRPDRPPLLEWRALFEANPGCIFVDLQYDDSSAERAALAEATGCHLHRPECDLREELDELAALLCALELIITVGNVNAPFAGALGAPVWRLFSSLRNDPMGLGADHYPWFSSMTLVPQNTPAELFLPRMFGAWRRGFHHFHAARREPLDAARRGLFSRALALLGTTPAVNPEDAALQLYLLDLCRPAAPLPAPLVSAAGRFGALVAAARSRAPLAQSPLPADDEWYYALCCAANTDAITALTQMDDERRARLPEFRQVIRERALREYFANRLQLVPALAASLSSPTAEEAPMITYAAFALLAAGEWSRAWTELARARGLHLGDPEAEEPALPQSPAIDAQLDFAHLIWLSACLGALPRGGVVSVPTALRTLFERSFPELRFVESHRPDSAAGTPRPMALEQLARRTLTGYHRLRALARKLVPDPAAVEAAGRALHRDGKPIVLVEARWWPRIGKSFERSPLPFQLLQLPLCPAALSDPSLPTGPLAPTVTVEQAPDEYAALFAAADLVVTDHFGTAVLAAAVGARVALVSFADQQLPEPPPLFPGGRDHPWFGTLEYLHHPDDLVGECRRLLSATASHARGGSS